MPTCFFLIPDLKGRIENTDRSSGLNAKTMNANESIKQGGCGNKHGGQQPDSSNNQRISGKIWQHFPRDNIDTNILSILNFRLEMRI